MSQNPPPSWPNGAPPPSNGHSPFQPLQPPPGSQPYGDPGAPYAGPAQPYDGEQPLGAPAPGHVTIDDFKPRRRVAPALIIGITVAIVVGIIAAAVLLGSKPPKLGPTPTPTRPKPAATSTRTPTLPGQGVAWESNYDNANGYWEITKQTWQNDGVVLTLSVTVDQGSFTPSFYVFNNESTAQYRASYNAPDPTFPTSSLNAPKTYTGNVFIAMPHVEGTLIMVSAHQVDAISALPIHK